MSRNRSCPWRANVAGSTGIGLDSVYRDIAWPKIRERGWEKRRWENPFRSRINEAENTSRGAPMRMTARYPEALAAITAFSASRSTITRRETPSKYKYRTMTSCLGLSRQLRSQVYAGSS
jgi:hypothetical protein